LALRNHIEELMKDHGNLSVSDLARLTNIPQPTLHHLITGATRRPRPKLLKTLADFFSITTEELIDAKRKNQPVPMLQWHELKDLQNLNSLNIKDHTRTKVLTELSVSQNAFALIAKDNMMEPLFSDGCILIFDPVRNSQDRNFVLVYLNDMQDYFVKRLFIENKSQYISLSDEIGKPAELYKLTTQDQVLATLVEAKMQF